MAEYLHWPINQSNRAAYLIFWPRIIAQSADGFSPEGRARWFLLRFMRRFPAALLLPARLAVLLADSLHRRALLVFGFLRYSVCGFRLKDGSSGSPHGSGMRGILPANIRQERFCSLMTTDNFRG